MDLGFSDLLKKKKSDLYILFTDDAEDRDASEMVGEGSEREHERDLFSSGAC